MALLLKTILKKIDYLEFIGNENSIIKGVVQLDKIKQNSILWCSDKNLHKLKNASTCTIIVSTKFKTVDANPSCNFIVVDNPRRTFQLILSAFFSEKPKRQISNTAKIHKTVQLGDSALIGENVVIEKNCVIGKNVTILHNSVIFSETKISDNVIIGANSTIGGVGFGYEKNQSGDFELIPHIGNVIIESNVEIGNNVCIDRAVLGSTLLKQNSKIDNLVHIAHGVSVGKNTVVIANAMVGGSTQIGDNVWVAPSASLLNKIIINDNSLVGMASNVIKNVESYSIVAGNPAKVIKTINH